MGMYKIDSRGFLQVQKFCLGAFVLFLFFVQGCGEIVTLGVVVETEPSGATVTVGSTIIGKTPVLVPRKFIKDHYLETWTVEISKDGFKTYQTVLNQKKGTIKIPLEKNN